ncbi:MAG: D-alanyl-D-alanine carboxypeptidase/D-alanyl-D-alanine-endopeptidase (penicillin-binding protein 4), partial [Saprospiraceae bacterium]
DQLAADPALNAQGFSMTVMDVESGSILAQHQKDRGLIPASSLKVVVTSTALALLGDDFKFKTELQYDGSIDQEGTLNGNLYIKGYGDPTLGSDQFEKTIPLDALMDEFIAAIQATGIRRINGKIIGDASFFGTQVDGRTWLWEDLGNYYGAGAWGLNIHENKYFLTFQRSTKPGETPEIEKVEPHIPNLLHINEVVQADKNSDDEAYIFGSVYNYTRFIRGTIPAGTEPFTIKGSIPDPPFFAAYYLMKKLEAQEIQTNKEATSLFELEKTSGFKSKKRNVLHTHYSPSLVDIIGITNLKSINLYCEAMLRYLGKDKKGEGSAEAGIEVIYDYLKTKGFNTGSFFMEDGSGLSTFNTVSSFQLATIMRLIANDKSLYTAFRPSLPVAGLSGGLKYMFRGTAAKGRIWAKTGGMKRVRSYTGYAESKTGKLLAFSIICNHFTGESSAMRKKMKKVMLAMVE